jgi:cyclic beta-1,2-glucan synthetase
MLTSDGDGFSSCDQIRLSRFRADRCGGGYGQFIYVRNLNTGDFFSPAFHPTRVRPDSYKVLLTPEKVEYRRRDGSLLTSLDVTISPFHNMEIRR